MTISLMIPSLRDAGSQMGVDTGPGHTHTKLYVTETCQCAQWKSSRALMRMTGEEAKVMVGMPSQGTGYRQVISRSDKN